MMDIHENDKSLSTVMNQKQNKCMWNYLHLGHGNKGQSSGKNMKIEFILTKL